MKIEGKANESVILTFETMKEVLAISTALSICLIHWHKEGLECIDSHIEIAENMRTLLRST